MEMFKFAVRILLVTEDGSSHERVYAQRSANRQSRETFVSASLGNLIAMVTTGFSDSLNIGDGPAYNYATGARSHFAVVSWSVQEISLSEVMERRGENFTERSTDADLDGLVLALGLDGRVLTAGLAPQSEAQTFAERWADGQADI